eukprot:UN03948
MNSFLNRLNIIVLYALMVMIITALLSNIALISYSPKPYVGINNVDLLAYGKPTYPSPYSHIFMHTQRSHNVALLKFDLDLDLRSCLTWSTKQIMVWLVVEYSTKTPLHIDRGVTEDTYTTNQVVVWDHIVQNDYDPNNEELDVFIEGMEVKYPLSEIAGKIDWDRPVTIKLQWEITPMLGIFQIFDTKNQRDIRSVDFNNKIKTTSTLNQQQQQIII